MQNNATTLTFDLQHEKTIEFVLSWLGSSLQNYTVYDIAAYSSVSIL
jgi:hypothetical protein